MEGGGVRRVIARAISGSICALSIPAPAALVIPAQGGAESAPAVIATGSLTNAAGEPLQATVRAYPSMVERSGLSRSLGTATTDSSGHFTITASDPASLRKAAADNGGIANLTLMADAGSWSGVTFAPVDAGSGRAGATSTDAKMPA